MTSPYVQNIIDLHPGVHFFLGQAQSGKTTLMQYVLSQWPGHSLAIDCNATDPPAKKHLARYGTWWAEEMPAQLPPGVSAVASDECVNYTKELPRDELMFQLVRRGQHQLPHGVTALLGSQRPMDIGQDAWGQAKTVTIGRILGAPDLQRLATLPGMTRDIVARLPTLEPGWFVVWHQSGVIELPRCFLAEGA